MQGVFGDAVTAFVVPVDVKRCNDDIDERGICMLTEPMQIFCGLVDNIASGYDMILPTEMADKLMSLPLLNVLTTSVCDDIVSDDQMTDDDVPENEQCVETVVNVDCMNDSFVHNVNSDSDVNCGGKALIDEQRNDSSLAGCHALAAAGKRNFVYRNGRIVSQKSYLWTTYLAISCTLG